jgi:hypothetical protein
MTARSSLVVLGLVAFGSILCGACGGDDPPTKTKTEPGSEPAPIVVPPSAAGSTGDATTGDGPDPFDSEGWAGGETDTDDGAAAGDAPEPAAGATTPVYAAPCTVRWTGGPILRFKHDADGKGGLLRIDGDNDGRADVCARFWLADGKTNKITVDEGCDKTTDAVITPTWEAGQSVGTATWSDQRPGKEAKHEITLLALPAFTGIAPGYPLYAARSEVKLEQKDGRVLKAEVREPVDGPPVKVTFKYDDQGRATRIDEDHGADGKLDRRFDYRYDEVGNVIGITLTDTDFSGGGKGKKTKKTAKLSYTCWAEKKTE